MQLSISTKAGPRPDGPPCIVRHQVTKANFLTALNSIPGPERGRWGRRRQTCCRRNRCPPRPSSGSLQIEVL